MFEPLKNITLSPSGPVLPSTAPLHPASLIPILRQPLQQTPPPQSLLIFYTSPSSKLSHPRKESLHHSLLTAFCKTSRPSHPSSPLSTSDHPPCCCHTNPWPFLFALFRHGPYCPGKKEKVGRDGRQRRKKRGGGERGENVPSLFSGQEGSTHVRVWKFRCSFLLFFLSFPFYTSHSFGSYFLLASCAFLSLHT